MLLAVVEHVDFMQERTQRIRSKLGVRKRDLLDAATEPCRDQVDQRRQAIRRLGPNESLRRVLIAVVESGLDVKAIELSDTILALLLKVLTDECAEPLSIRA